MWDTLLRQLIAGDLKALARVISLVENEEPGYQEFMCSLPTPADIPIIGVTGPPGAGKSTLVDGLISEFVKENSRTCILCVDPSSPFTSGAVLGDRVRMNSWYKTPGVYIRSLATRGSLGGLHPKIVEITELAKAAGFHQIIIETVGVGQSEIEIAGLADITMVVLVPGSGDDIQSMKAGLMEIADIFVINKSDRPGADKLDQDLHLMMPRSKHIPIIKTIATEKVGIRELIDIIKKEKLGNNTDRQVRLLADKAFHLIQNNKMKGISRETLLLDLQQSPGMNLYQFIGKY